MDDLAQYDRIMCNRSLYYLCKEVLGYKDMVPHVHGYMCDFMTNPIYGRRRQLCVPRSFFKTWVCTVGKAIWLTLPDEEGLWTEIYPYKGPNVRILIASYARDLSAKMVHKIRDEWENNERLRAAYPDLIPHFNKVRWSDLCAEVRRTIRATEGTYTAVGVGGSVVSQHFDHIFEDDLIYAKKDDFTGQELFPSKEDIDKAIGWHKVSTSLLVNAQIGCIDNIGTRWAPYDLINYIRENEKNYACFELSVTKNAKWPIESDDDCIWPERFNKEVLEELYETQKAQIFETQYLNRPRAHEDIVFDTKQIVIHNSISDYPQDLEYKTFVDLSGWRSASRSTKGQCRTVILTGAKSKNNHIWVARLDAGRLNPEQVINIMSAHSKAFNSKVFVEAVGYQIAIEFFSKYLMTQGLIEPFPIEPLPLDNRSGAKDLRIQALQPIVSCGMLHILDNMKDLVEEMNLYPRGTTVDIIDTLGYLHKHTKGSNQSIEKPKQSYNPFSFESIIEEIESKKRSKNNLYSIQLGKRSEYTNATIPL